MEKLGRTTQAAPQENIDKDATIATKPAFGGSKPDRHVRQDKILVIRTILYAEYHRGLVVVNVECSCPEGKELWIVFCVNLRDDRQHGR